MKKLLINILTTYKYEDIQKSILNTWLKNYNEYVFYTDKINNIGNQISVTDKSSYEYCGLKQINRFKQIIDRKEYLNYDFFLFCDDDTVVNTKKLLKFVEDADTNYIYGCVGNTWTVDKNLFYCSGGAGFLVSAQIFKNYIKYPFLYPHDDGEHHHMYGYSDVQAGLFFRDNNFKCKNIEGFYSGPPDGFGIKNDDYEKIKNSYTFHHIKTNEQREKISNIFNN